MKTAKHILNIAAFILVAAALTTGCAKERLVKKTTSGETYKVTLEVGSADTRTTITQSTTENKLPVVWKTDDKVIVAGATDGYLGTLTLTKIDESDAHKATFEGALNNMEAESQTLHVYYIGDTTVTTFADDKFTFDISSQNGTLENIAKRGHIAHAATSTTYAPGNQTITVGTMENMNAVILFDLSAWASTGVTITGTYNKAVLDLKTGTFDKTSCKGNIALAAADCGAKTYVTFVPDTTAFTFKSGTYSTPTANTSMIAGKFYSKDGDAIKIPAQNVDLSGYTEDGWSYGPGIEINGVVWAPVNCGVGRNYAYPYGKLYQWGRKYGNGYNENDPSVPTNEYITSALTAYPDGDSFNPKFYYGISAWYNGTDPAANKLWLENSRSSYDPCPSGWRVPTKTELMSLLNNTTGGTATTSTWVSKSGSQLAGRLFYGNTSKTGNCIFLPSAGMRDETTGSASQRDNYGYYLSSTNSSGVNSQLIFYQGNSTTISDNIPNSRGCSVRCVQDSTGMRGILNGQEYVIIKGSDGKYLKWATQNLAVTTSGKVKWNSTNYIIGDYFQWAASYAGYGITAEALKTPASLVIYDSFTSTCTGGSSDSFTFKTGKTDGFKMLSNAPYCNGTDYTKYTIAPATLALTDDVANIVLGSTWRIPKGGSTGEIKAMREATYWAWDATDKGYYVFKPGVGTSGSANGLGTIGTGDDKTNALLFLPAAGVGYSDVFQYMGAFGYYWSGTLYSDDTDQANFLHFNLSGVSYEGPNLRRYGFSVRPVSD